MTTDEVAEVLRKADWLGEGESFQVSELTGGVSSIILKVEAAGRPPVCLKRALTRLKVAEAWEADPARNAAERDSLRLWSSIVPGSTPALLHEDPARQLFLMEFLTESRTWKEDLLAGRVAEGPASRCGEILGRIHAETSHRPELGRTFANHELFEQLRIDPYLRTAGRRHPDLAALFDQAIGSLHNHRLCLIHGDFSPKNILLLDSGRIVVLDHEVAVFGDPAFDLAFLLNHLFLKQVVRPDCGRRLRREITCFLDAYRAHTHDAAFENPLSRATRLLPMLMLARIDGKSPVEYLDATQRGAVRDFSRSMIRSEAPSPHAFTEAFAGAFNA